MIGLSVYLQANWIISIDEIGKRILSEQIHGEFSQLLLRIATVIGDPIFTAILLLAVTITLWMKDKRRSLWLLLAIILSGGVVPRVLKYMIARPRPEYALYVRGGYSFPSGHTTGAIVLYGMLIAIALLWLKKSWKRNLLILIAMTFIRLFAKSSEKVKLKISSFQINHGNEIINVFKATSSTFNFLNAAIDAFHSASSQT